LSGHKESGHIKVGSGSKVNNPVTSLLYLSELSTGTRTMLELAIGLLIIALVAGALGFTGIARGAASIAKFIFVAFLVVAGLIFVLGLLGIIALF
jgi:uncharacterized membrane protein YtjA (UPF0391 family)